MSIEAMKQALEALEQVFDDMDPPDAAITALRTAIEQAEKVESDGIGWLRKDGGYFTAPAAPVQVSPTDFVDMVMDKEDTIGKPIFWAEWPNREKNT